MGKRRCLIALAAALVGGACTSTLDAGHDNPYGLLPVDQRNALIVMNDGAYDNWFGEYAVLLANGGGSPLVGIIVDKNSAWSDIQTNVNGYRDLLEAARNSGLRIPPDPTTSLGAPLVMPASGAIEDTQPNRSEGARLIIDVSKKYALPYRPVVIATGGALTDVADAYLVDPTVAERVVVVSSLGSVTDTGAVMSSPNGDGDPWADVIVTSRFQYVQVSAWYDQLKDVQTSDLSRLPNNPLGAWIAAKQPNLWQWSPASDQVAVLAAGLPAFATAVERVSPTFSVDAGAGNGPDLTVASGTGGGWLVTGCNGAAATAAFWRVLLGTH